MLGNPQIGSSFDDFLSEEGLLEECQTHAIKQVLSWQIQQAMKEQSLTKTEMAKRMQTSRSALDRLLDPDNSGVTLHTMQQAARTVGKRLRLELVD